jgi:hypothetical protein
MKLRLLLFVWVLFVPIGSGNEIKATLRVVVKDELGAVIPRSKLLVRWDPASLQVEASKGENPDTTSQADERGQMAIELNSGFYDVLVTSPAFTPSCKKVRIKTGTPVSIEFKLKADPLVTAELGHEIYSN